MEVLSYQCPNCGAPLEFNSETQNWDCKFCLSSFTLEDLEDFDKKQQKEEEEEEEQQAEEGAKKCYYCPNCGAELVTDESTVATFCTFCGNPSVLTKELDGKFQPERLIPFQINKEQAQEELYRLCRKKPLLPKDFTDKAHIEKVSGIYVPFWLSDCYVDASVEGTGEIVKTWRRGDTQYTKVSVYRLERSGALTYHNLPTDASRKMDDKMMDALEPFSYRQLRKFHTGYLSGYFAQRYDVGKEESQQRIKERIEKSAEEKLRNSCMGYSSVQITSKNVDILKSQQQYVMLPVWLLYTKYKEKDYLFAINGQTGKMVGDLPMSIPKIFAFAGLITAITTILGTIGGLLLC